MLPYSASKGKVIRAINTNSDSIVGEGLTQSGRTIASVEQGITTPPINAIGVITNTGPYGSEDDYKGCDYWVQLLQNFTSFPYNNGKDGPLLLGQSASTVDAQQNPVDCVITAHNPAEYAANTHNIALNTIVELLPIYLDRPTDLQSTQFIRWIIVSASSGPQQFMVAALPAAVSGIVPPYTICNAYSNTSTGTMNVSVGVIQAREVGDVFFASPISQITASGSALLDANGSTVTWIEGAGNYGVPFETACRPNGGTNGSAGVLCTLTYDLYDPSNTTKLAGPLSRTKAQGFGYAVVPANGPANGNASSGCLAKISNTGAWVLIEPYESTGSKAC